MSNEPERLVPREFVGGPWDQDIRVCSVYSIGCALPVLDRNGNTMIPARWSQYKLGNDDRMHYMGDDEQYGLSFIGKDLPPEKRRPA